ncbi:MAG: thermonuclease family protein [Granulosicoccaceae bacterium]
MQLKFRSFAVLFGISLLGACSLPLDTTEHAALAVCETTRVKDGDSVLARCDGEDLEIRLVCIDAPELSQKPYGAWAKRALTGLLGESFQADYQGKDRYGRTLATLWRDQRDLNLELLSTGDAVLYRKYCSKSKYLAAEAAARNGKIGVWDGEYSFIMPWEWRRR